MPLFAGKSAHWVSEYGVRLAVLGLEIDDVRNFDKMGPTSDVTGAMQGPVSYQGRLHYLKEVSYVKCDEFYL